MLHHHCWLSYSARDFFLIFFIILREKKTTESRNKREEENERTKKKKETQMKRLVVSAFSKWMRATETDRVKSEKEVEENEREKCIHFD